VAAALSVLAGISPYLDRLSSGAAGGAPPVVDDGAQAVESSRGCTGSECIRIDGTGLWLNEVEADYLQSLAPRFCGRQVLWHKWAATGRIDRVRSSILCAPRYAYISHVFKVSRFFGDRDRVCVYLST